MTRQIAMLLLLLITLTAAGCSLGKKPAPNDKEPGTEQPQQVARLVYFSDWQAQHLVPEERQIPAGDGAKQATAVIHELLAGPQDPNLHRTLRPETRLLEDVKVEEGIAKVNLSPDLLQMRGAAAVTMALGSLQLSLLEVPGVEQVQILVEGKAGAILDEGLVLDEPFKRPFYGDIPYLPDLNRVRYLQDQVSKGEEAWRTDPAQVLHREGRSFSFPLDLLTLAQPVAEGDKMVARIPYRGTIYSITMAQNIEVKTNPIWYVESITSHQVEAGGLSQVIFFSDRQAVNVLPEIRVLVNTLGEQPTAVVSALLAGPTDPFLVKLFPAGTELRRSVTAKDGVATVDFSKEFRKLSGSAETSRAIDGLVYSLTEIPSIHSVQILVEGKSGETVGNFTFTSPISRGPFHEQYYLDPDRVAWLQSRVQAEPWRLDPLATLMWEGRAFGMSGDLLKTATIERQGDQAVATLDYQGKHYRIEMGKKPGENGIWFIKGIKAS